MTAAQINPLVRAYTVRVTVSCTEDDEVEAVDAADDACYQASLRQRIEEALDAALDACPCGYPVSVSADVDPAI